MLIDVTRLVARALKGQLPTGVDRVSLNYVEHFYAVAQAVVRYGGRWLELSQRDSQKVFDALLRPDVSSVRVFRWCIGRSYALRWGNSREPALLFNTGHSGLDQPGYAVAVQHRRLKPIFFLHDLIPITHPEYNRPGEAEKHLRRLATMLTTGCGLLVNSKSTLDSLTGFAATQGWKIPPCAVAPLAPAKLPPAAAARPIAEPYFVILGTIEPRKNHMLLLHLWRQLVEEHGAMAPRLVIIGQRGWECEQVVDLLERCKVLQGFVIEKPNCSDADLATWLHHARALLFPSFVEGFGIPLIEALVLGTPVIASDLPVFHEIAGEIPEYVDPLDGPGWKRMVRDYLPQDSLRYRAQRARMQGYVAPTWENHFVVVDGLMQRVGVLPG